MIQTELQHPSGHAITCIKHHQWNTLYQENRTAWNG